MSESDPGCVKTSVSRGCRELFSHFRLLAEVASAIEFPHLRNLERCSTRKLNDGVFTQPESFPDISAVWTLVCFISTNGHCHQCVAPAEVLAALAVNRIATAARTNTIAMTAKVSLKPSTRACRLTVLPSAT